MFAISSIWCSSLDLEEKLMSLSMNEFHYFELCEKHVPQAIGWSARPWQITNLSLDEPVPEKIAETPSLASDNQQERQQAMARVLALCDKAREFKTPYVVIWPGHVPLTLSGQESAATFAIDEAGKSCREHLAQAFVQRLCRSLFEIAQLQPEITLCLPPARFACELLLHRELQWILEDLPKLKIAYWHNSASCYAQEKSGFATSEAWLESYASRLAGAHLEDWFAGQAMCPPGTGEVALRKLHASLPASAIRVLRLAPRFGEAELLACCQFLQEIDLL